CSAAMLKECFLSLCGHSLYAYEENLAQGYITLPGGHRVGVAGRCLRQDGRTAGVQEVSSLNIRVARTQLLLVEDELDALLKKTRPRILLLGEPGTGKTTLLRAMTARLSQLGRRVTVVDERMELWPMSEEGFAVLPPLHCDVLSGYPKGEGMQLALRSLAPEILVCDEIGAQEDAAALETSLHTGTGVLVSAHAACAEDALQRPQLRYLLERRCIEDIVWLKGRNTPGKTGGICHAADLMQNLGGNLYGDMLPWRGPAVRRTAVGQTQSHAGCGCAFAGAAAQPAI
ncbi:MAG: ATPase, T2SS/T4P/T4SS family, partial [Oscillospiraceae bacterium]|nr:ATPase, T2SS/T4P/T4SS family [Oscillospiraceae bacterium]